MLKSTLRLGVAVVACLVTLFAGLILSLTGAFKLHLFWVDSRIIIYIGGIMLVVTGLLLRLAHAPHAAAWFTRIGTTLVITLTITIIVGRTTVGRAIGTFLDIGSGAVKTAADIAIAPRPTECKEPLLIGEDHRNRYWYSPYDSELICYQCLSEKACSHLVPLTQPVIRLMKKSTPTPSSPPLSVNVAVDEVLPPPTTQPEIVKNLTYENDTPSTPVIIEDHDGMQYTLPHS